MLGERTILLMANHGVTVVGPSIHEAFDELYIAERTCMYQMTAMSRRPAAPAARRRICATATTGPWGERFDARLHLDAWRRMLDREEPDYAT